MRVYSSQQLQTEKCHRSRKQVQPLYLGTCCNRLRVCQEPVGHFSCARCLRLRWRPVVVLVEHPLVSLRRHAPCKHKTVVKLLGKFDHPRDVYVVAGQLQNGDPLGRGVRQPQAGCSGQPFKAVHDMKFTARHCGPKHNISSCS
eukprot:764717-Hanusia_phi.AAC.2